MEQIVKLFFLFRGKEEPQPLWHRRNGEEGKKLPEKLRRYAPKKENQGKKEKNYLYWQKFSKYEKVAPPYIHLFISSFSSHFLSIYDISCECRENLYTHIMRK